MSQPSARHSLVALLILEQIPRRLELDLDRRAREWLVPGSPISGSVDNLQTKKSCQWSPLNQYLLARRSSAALPNLGQIH